MENQVLSANQMAYLSKLGIDTSNASLIHKISDRRMGEVFVSPNGYDEGIRRILGRFTLLDIIKLIKNDCKGEFTLSMNILSIWVAHFSSLSREKVEDVSCRHESPLQAAYTILVWCAENGFMKGIKPKQK